MYAQAPLLAGRVGRRLSRILMREEPVIFHEAFFLRLFSRLSLCLFSLACFLVPVAFLRRRGRGSKSASSVCRKKSRARKISAQEIRQVTGTGKSVRTGRSSVYIDRGEEPGRYFSCPCAINSR